MYNLFSKNY